MPKMSLGQTCLRTAWLFQALSAAPVLLFLGTEAFTHFLSSIEAIYDFVMSLLTSLMAAGIIFVVLVQRQLRGSAAASKHLTLKFESAKAVLATGLWVWMMLDVGFNPLNNYRFFDRGLRLQATGFASILLLYVRWRG